MKHKKQYTSIFLLTFTLLCNVNLTAKTAIKTHSFEYQKGQMVFNENNLNAAPIRGITYQLNYKKSILGKTYRYFQFGAGSSSIRPHIFGKPRVATSNISFEYAYLIKTYSSNGFLSHTGIGASLNYNHSYHWEIPEDNIQWANFRGLHVVQKFSKKLENNNSIHHHFSMPIVMLLNRSDSETNNTFNEDFVVDMFWNIHQSTERVFLNKGVSLNYSFEYQIDKSKKFHPSFTFSMHHFSLQTSTSQRVNSLRLLIGIKYGF